MNDKFVPKLKLRADISETKIDTFNTPMRLENIFKTEEPPAFSDVFAGMVKNVDETMKAPDEVLNDVMMGNGADVHDVMIAMSKAELSLSVATQMTTKVIQAYEKVMSIQL